MATWLPALEARSWALLGAERETTRAVERARNRRDRYEPDDLDSVGGLLSFPIAKQHYYAGGAYVFLDGRADQAEQEASAAIEIFENGEPQLRSFSDEAGARTELALARVHAGSLDGARDALSPVLDLPSEHRIGGIVTSAGRVHQALRSRAYATSPIARGLREEIEAFCRVPAAALPA